MSRRFLVMLAVFALLMLPQAYAQDAEPVVLDGMPAPYSKEYRDWVNGTKRVTSGQDSESGTTVYYGLTPMPVDLSHLKKNPPKNSGPSSALPTRYTSVLVPSAYDLRAYKLLPDVRNQNPFGTCWAFSALGAMESNYIKNNPDAEIPDLSEMHLAWFLYKNPEEGKAVKTHDIGSGYKDFILDQGGNPGNAIAFLSRLAGPVKESALPYPTKSILGLYPYDTGDRPADGAKPEDYGSAVMRVSDASFYTDYTDVPEPNNEMRKQLIMDKGAMQIVYYSVSGSYSKGGGTTVFFNNTTGTDSNHAVLIVGWDDDFPRENFPESMRPENNGAWLVRNSWGDGWADDGYFWMSYEQYIRYAVAYTVKTDSPKIYVYDDLGWTASFSYKWAANVFQAGDTAEAVTEVGFYTTDNNAPYEIYVYDLGETHPGKPVPADVTEMTPVESGTMAYAGYHTVELGSPVTIPAGHYFSVVMRMDQAEDASFSSMVAVEMSDQYYPAVYHEGESYFYSKVTAGGKEVMPAGSYLSYWKEGKDTGYSINACIKAFTVEAEIGIAVDAVNFPDEVFRSYVSENFDTDKDGYLSDEEIANVTSINVARMGISSLTGVEYFTSLTYLDCNENRLKELDVSKITALMYLNCSSNQLTELDVSNNSALEVLWCEFNQLTNLNLSKNTELSVLWCYDNQLTQLDLSNNIALTELYCHDNQLTQLDLSKNTNLETLLCVYNQLTTLDVSNNTNLRELRCNNNNLTSLTLGNNSVLSTLNCENNSLTQIDISGCPKLASGIFTHDDSLTIIDGSTSEVPAFKSANLILSGQIGVNFYLDLPAISGVDYYDSSTCYMAFDINGNTTSNNPQPTDGSFKDKNNYFGYRCYINSVQMADSITAEFHYGDGKIVSYDYSAKKYLDNRLQKTTNEHMRKLAVAIKNYGHYAQIYLSRINGWKIGEKHVELDAATEYTSDEIESVRSIIDAYKPVLDDYTGTGITGVQYNLELAAETTINLTFKMDSGYSGSVFASLNGGSENMAVRQADGTYKVQIAGISAHRLADTQTVKVTAAKDFTVKVSALTFSYTSLKGADMPEDRQNLGAALYNYYKYSVEYKNNN